MHRDTAARTPQEIVDALGTLEAPAPLDQAEMLLRELPSALTGQDDLAVSKWGEEAARALKGKVGAPTRLVAAALAPLRGGRRVEAAQGRAVEIFAPEPSRKPVDGSELLFGLVRAIRRYIVLTESVAVAVALWVLHTHCLEAARNSPRLAITSPVMRCGKTLLLEILEHLVCKALNVASITAAALFRAVEKYRPTLLIDEADTFLVDKEELRGVLNSGHRRNGRVVRTSGDTHEPYAFSTFAPVAIAMIGRLPSTLADRSIPVEMRRRKREETVATFRSDRLQDLTELQSQAARFALDHLDDLQEADPAVPPELHDRAADNWRPLLAIADAAGGEWPAMARKAAKELSGGAPAQDDEPLGLLLLSDLRTIFEEAGESALFSEFLLDQLSRRQDRPWAEWRADKPLSALQLAKLLRPFGIHPRQVRIENDSKKGYERAWFGDAFARYLPPFDPKHLKQTNGISDLRAEPTRNTMAFVSGGASLETTDNKGDDSEVSGVSGLDGELDDDTRPAGGLHHPGATPGSQDKLRL